MDINTADTSVSSILTTAGAALPSILELATMLAKVIIGTKVDPVAVKEALDKAHADVGSVLDAIQASHDAARAKAEKDLES